MQIRRKPILKYLQAQGIKISAEMMQAAEEYYNADIFEVITKNFERNKQTDDEIIAFLKENKIDPKSVARIEGECE